MKFILLFLLLLFLLLLLSFYLSFALSVLLSFLFSFFVLQEELFDIEFTAEEQEQAFLELCNDHFPHLVPELQKPADNEPAPNFDSLQPDAEGVEPEDCRRIVRCFFV